MKHSPLFLLISILIILTACTTEPSYEISGELKQWHKVTLTFDGPESEETAEVNPYTDYRLSVRFEKEGKAYDVPGYYAADGQAGASSAEAGNKWRVHFNPDEAGIWQFKVSFRKGKEIAIRDEADFGETLAFDGTEGELEIFPSDKSGSDFRAKGRIQISDNGHYFQHAGSGDYFLKAGADSPENFLAFHEFDGTYRHLSEAREGEADPKENLHRYEAHLQDWKAGDPTWQDGKGKAMIGALNYLASKGMNALYFLVMNINGDGKDVWPYLSHEERMRFDCSKLDQWEVVFEHMEKLGLLMHVVTQETENELLLDKGNTERERKLYYRELIARFAHHNALVWNLGEENGPADFSPDGQNTAQRKAMASYLKEQDPYQHPVVLHTHSVKAQKDEILKDLLGFPALDGLSFQVNKREHVHEETIKWLGLADESGNPWLIAMDEIGFWYTGVMPDEVNPAHDTIRSQVLWGSLMAGAAGVEWYFGAHYPHNDLTCEDWRSRENMWDQTRYALEFFHSNLNFWEMESRDDLIKTTDAYCLADPGKKYALYFPIGASGKRMIDLEDQEASFSVSWYNPRSGGSLTSGSVAAIKGPGWQDIGMPEADSDQDWVALIRTE